MGNAESRSQEKKILELSRPFKAMAEVTSAA